MDDIFSLTFMGGWLLASLVLILVFNVLRRRGLAKAPVRESRLTLGLAGGIFLLYMGSPSVAWMIISGLHHPAASPTTAAASAAATAAATSTAPATAPSGDLPTMVHGNLAMILAGVMMVWLLLVVMRYLMAGGLQGWGVSLRQLPRGLWYGAIGWAIVHPWLEVITLVIIAVLGIFGKQLTVHQTLVVIRDAPLQAKIILSIAAGVTAPIVEEFVFRGVIQTTLVQRYWGMPIPRRPSVESAAGALQKYIPSPSHRWLAIVMTSITFAAIHRMPDQFLVLFVLSLALGYVYERTGNLWASVTLHAVFNGVNLAGTLLSSGT